MAQFLPVFLHQTIAEQLGQVRLRRGARGTDGTRVADENQNPKARLGPSLCEGGTEYPPHSKDGYGLWDQGHFGGLSHGVVSLSLSAVAFQSSPWRLGELLGQSSWASGGILFLITLGSPSPAFGAVVFWT